MVRFLHLKDWMAPSLVAIIMLMFHGHEAQAQKRTVSGTVKSEDGEMLPGVSILEKGTTNGTVTDGEGKFTFSISGENPVLVFSFIGMITQEIEAGAQTNFKVTLQADLKTLDEVLVVDVGYATVKKSDLTGAIASLDTREIQKVPVQNVGQLLAGRLPGVQVTVAEGSPDADIRIRIRGGGSITQDNSPLYIVDGFRVTDINNIAPADIESFQVLKDAASTAIYGSAGANGVIIITTRTGKEGKVSVNFDAYTGKRYLANNLKVLNPYEYVMYQYELDQSNTFKGYYGAYEDLEIYKSVEGRNWVREIFGREALVQNYNLSVNGGTKQIKYSLGFTRTDEQSIMIGSGFERNNFNLKIDSDLGKVVSIDFNNRLTYQTTDGAGVSSGSGANTRLRNAVKYAPTLGLREFTTESIDDDDANSPESASLLYDPVQSTLDDYKKQFQFTNNSNLAFNFKILKDLTFRTAWGYQFTRNRTDRVFGPSTSDAKNNGGQPIGNIFNQERDQWSTSNTLTYGKKNIFSGHNLNVMVGQEIVSRSRKDLTSESRFFPAKMKIDEVLADMRFGTPQKTVSYIAADDNLSSYFGRLNYSINDKYLATLTVRADGTSRFAQGQRWGVFPGSALAWKLSEEQFLKDITWLSSLKLRASYGAAGNNNIPNGAMRSPYTTSNDNNPYWPNENEGTQLVPSSSLGNSKLKWETTWTSNIGVDFQLFKARINGTLDVYQNVTKDLLVQAPLPTASGYGVQYQNFGQTSNKGIELSLEGIILEKQDLFVSTTFNISFNRNNVDKFQNGDADFKTYSSGWNGSADPLDDFIVQEGMPVGLMYGYITEGMYTFEDFTFDETTKSWKINDGVPDSRPLTSSMIGPGMLKLKDVNGDGKIDADDKRIIGNANPKHTGGFGLNARYKGFDLTAFFNWSFGNDIYNANKIDYSAYGLTRKYQNIVDEMSLANRFTIIDPATGLNVYQGNNADPERLKEINQNATIWSPIMTRTPLHSWAVEDGSFLRINNVSLGYSLPGVVTQRLRLNNLRVYVTGNNLYTFTRYTGFDPEVNTRRGTPVTPGVDYSAYPRSRSFVAGINVTF